jgi:hypothetical protein
MARINQFYCYSIIWGKLKFIPGLPVLKTSQKVSFIFCDLKIADKLLSVHSYEVVKAIR